MNRLYNYKPFTYQPRKDIDEFLNESDLWNELYETFLTVKDNTYRLKVSSVVMFNEVYYQCVRVAQDSHPEEDVWYNYLNDARDNLGWRYASDLCFSIAYAALSLMQNPPRQATRFCAILAGKIFANDAHYFPAFKELVDRLKSEGKLYDVRFLPTPMKPGDIFSEERTSIDYNGNVTRSPLYDDEWWKNVTDNFCVENIKEIVSLWSEPKDKLSILERIEEAYQTDEQKRNAPVPVDDLPY